MDRDKNWKQYLKKNRHSEVCMRFFWSLIASLTWIHESDSVKPFPVFKKLWSFFSSCKRISALWISLLKGTSCRNFSLFTPQYPLQDLPISMIPIVSSPIECNGGWGQSHLLPKVIGPSFAPVIPHWTVGSCAYMEDIEWQLNQIDMVVKHFTSVFVLFTVSCVVIFLIHCSKNCLKL